MAAAIWDSAKQWAFDELRDTSLDLVEALAALSLVSLNPVFPAIAEPLASSFRLLVMGTYGLAVCIGGVVVMASESLQERYSAREIVPRLVAGFLLAYFASDIIWLVQDFDTEITTAFTLGEAIGGSLEGSDFLDYLAVEARDSVSGIDFVVAIMQLVAAFVLWLCMITRNMAWFVVAVFAPVALAMHGLPFTEGLAWVWWRMLWACFFSSVGQAALIWVWMNIYTDLDDVEVLLYYSLRPFYMMVLTWIAWRLHKDLFIWAKGTPLRIPGSRLAKTVVGSAVGIALFKLNPVGKIAALALGRFRNRRAAQQAPNVPPVPPPLPGPGPRTRPTPPDRAQPALVPPPYAAGSTTDVPPRRPNHSPASSEQLPARRASKELEPAPPGRWKAGQSPERPPEPDGPPDALPTRSVRGAIEPAPPGQWETGPARWVSGASTASSPERTADTTAVADSSAWEWLRRPRPQVVTMLPPEPATRPARTSPVPATPIDVARIKRPRRGRNGR